jgi:anti-sigma factor RsiW
MTQTTEFRDVERISAYLDGQLSQAEKARLEARLKIETQLRSTMDEVNYSRVLLRKLPARRAPRNFTLSPKMAGVKPPLPRAFPIFRMASALATVLFFFVFAANLSVPTWASIRPAASAQIVGLGEASRNTSPFALEAAAPAAPQADTAAVMAPTQEVSRMQPAPTQGAIEMFAATGTPVESGAQAKVIPSAQGQPALAAELTPTQPPVSAVLQFGLLGLAVISGGTAYFMRARADNRWLKAQALKPAKPGPGQILVFFLVFLVIIALSVTIFLISTTAIYAP